MTDLGVKAPVAKPPKADMGDYAVFVGKDAQKIKGQILDIKEIEKIEVAGPYINFFLKTNFLQEEFGRIAKDETHGQLDDLVGKTVLVEYTDPNPFKLFHIGHLMSNSIGETIARLHAASGAKVMRVNYQGDVGLHVAKAIFGLMQGQPLEKAYAFGSQVFDEHKSEIEAINKKIYDRSDAAINKLYDDGRKASLEYFEVQYKKLGTKFVHYFFESEMAPKGLELVKAHPEIFKESEGAIVFKGEDYGLHTRVFINSQGLPTYEAKELGLNQEKFKLYHPDLSIIVTANEITEYFRVLMKAMELVIPDVAAKTRHVPHGIMKLPSGKMSSRTGSVITADEFIDQVKETTQSEDVAIGAIKYSILRQGIGHDIVFDFEKSLSTTGDSGVYLQYTYARLKSILEKAGVSRPVHNAVLLTESSELSIIKHLMEFPDAIREATQRIAPNVVALYAYELANKANRFYEEVRILVDENEDRKQARLVLVDTVARILRQSLELLGITAPEKV